MKLSERNLKFYFVVTGYNGHDMVMEKPRLCGPFPTEVECNKAIQQLREDSYLEEDQVIVFPLMSQSEVKAGKPEVLEVDD